MAYQELDLSGKSAVVIGGVSGIGRAIALGLAEAGADVVPTSRRRDLVEQTANEIRTLGRRSVVCASDVLDRTSLEALLATTIEAFGKVDILANNAGILINKPLADVTGRTMTASSTSTSRAFSSPASRPRSG